MRLKELRKARGFTQKELAEAVGLSQPFLCQVENGRKQTTVGTLVKIAAALRVSVGELIGEKK